MILQRPLFLNNFYRDILHLYNIVFAHKFSNIWPEEGWYGKPKYCYKKNNTRCSGGYESAL